jgi:ribonuclease BN (tRNA processing enzyme)
VRFTILGRSPAVPNPGEACAGYLIEGGRTRVMVDVGPGTVAQLLRLCNPWELDAVIVSHMHTDHFLDLVTMRYSFPWKDEANPKLKVYMPPGATAQMETIARGIGIPEYFARSFAFFEHDGVSAIETGDLRFEPTSTVHFVPTWGFRMTARPASGDGAGTIGYSADSSPTPNLDILAERADLFICEAALRSVNDDASPPERRGHLVPEEAGEVAQRGGVGRLVLTHLPVNSDGGTWAVAQAGTTYEGPVEVADTLKAWEV